MERKADVKEIVNEALAYESLSRSRALSTPSFSASPVPGNQGGQRQTDRSFRPVSNDERRTSSARYRRYPPPTKRRDRQTRGTSYARAERLRNRRRESSVFDRLGAARRNGRHYHGTRHFHRRRHKPYDSFARTEDNLSVKVLQARKMSLSIQEHREKTKIIEKKINDEKNILDAVYSRIRKLKRQKEDNEKDRQNFERRFERLSDELRLKKIYWNGDFGVPVFKRPGAGPDDSSLLEEDSEEEGELIDDDEWSDDDTLTSVPSVPDFH